MLDLVADSSINRLESSHIAIRQLTRSSLFQSVENLAIVLVACELPAVSMGVGISGSTIPATVHSGWERFCSAAALYLRGSANSFCKSISSSYKELRKSKKTSIVALSEHPLEKRRSSGGGYPEGRV